MVGVVFDCRWKRGKFEGIEIGVFFRLRWNESRTGHFLSKWIGSTGGDTCGNGRCCMEGDVFDSRWEIVKNF